MFTKWKVILITGAVLAAGAAGVAAAQGPGPRKAKLLEKFDANNNGVLDPSEKQAMFDARAAKRFAKLDTNNDGALSLDEFKAGKQMKGRAGRGGKLRGKRGGGGPGQP